MSSKQPRKQRLAQYTAPYHRRHPEMSSPIEYAAIKSGIISITRWLAKYYRDCGIRVNCVSPGGIRDAQPASFLEKYHQSCTNIGMLKSEQVASAISFLLSPESIAINGQNIIVDVENFVKEHDRKNNFNSSECPSVGYGRVLS